MSDHIPGPGKMVSARYVVARAMLDSIGLSNTSAAQGEDNADAILSALAAAGYAVGDKVVLQIALLVLCAARDGQSWNINFLKDFDQAIDGIRAMLAAAKETQA
jgi:hypothetical protein